MISIYCPALIRVIMNLSFQLVNGVHVNIQIAIMTYCEVILFSILILTKPALL